MTRILIPGRLDERLGESPLAHAVRNYVQQFEAWVGDDARGLPFFPEYTDHGPRHIASVLAAAEALILEDAWSLVTAEDAAVLILATVLHDSAMHLREDGLLNLLLPESAAERPLLVPLDTRSWPQLFADFFDEARRWDQRVLHRILGDRTSAMQEEDLVNYIRHPNEVPDPEEWSIRYHKFLGEFVRRQHARLAHEIVAHGVPGSTLGVLKPPSELAWIADLAGLVARSHNLALRSTFDYLTERYYGRVTCRNTHPIFLMVLLRIADYLQLHSGRVNPTSPQIQRLRSPISQEEWDAHLAVHEVRPDEHDAEAIFVIAQPKTVREFVKLRSLLQGLQSELDLSWAVLGEVFSRQGALSRLGIILRRVRSNLDNPELFLRHERPSYFPVKATFDTAGADLLKLLITPLYGDRPEIGIRELLQNALDAVYELRQIGVDRGDTEKISIPLPHQAADVLISIDRSDDGRLWLTIRDKGVGMTEQTIRNYYLRAGSSFRQSDAWRRTYEQDKKSKVLRSGRFGIGVLASFLLGDRVEVSTRHVDAPENEGLHFSASINDDVIELQIVRLLTVGTTIRIQLMNTSSPVLGQPDSNHRLLENPRVWDWFTLEDPVVERRMLDRKLQQEFHLPSLLKDMPNWRRVKHRDYQAIYWSYAKTPGLVCNGIVVEESRVQRWSRPSTQLPFNTPSVCVFDRDGKLPLSLRRDSIEIPDFPFSTELLNDITADLCSFLILHSPRSRDLHLFRTGPDRAMLSHDFFKLDQYGHHYLSYLWAAPNGTSLAHPWYIKKAGVRHALLIVAKEGTPLPDLRGRSAEVDATFLVNRSPLDKIGTHFWRQLLLTPNDTFVPGVVGMRPTAFRALVRKTTASSFAGRKREGVAVHDVLEGCQLFEFGKFPFQDLRILESLVEEIGSNHNLLGAVEWSLDPDTIHLVESPFTLVLDNILSDPIVPFDQYERRELLGRALVRVKDHLSAWQPPQLSGWRQRMTQA